MYFMCIPFNDSCIVVINAIVCPGIIWPVLEGGSGTSITTGGGKGGGSLSMSLGVSANGNKQKLGSTVYLPKSLSL